MDLFQPLTPEQQTLLQIRDSAFGARAVMLAAVNNCEALVWKNPYGLSPQQVFDALGVAGADLVSMKAAVVPIFQASGGDQPTQLKPECVTLRVVDSMVQVSEMASVE